MFIFLIISIDHKSLKSTAYAKCFCSTEKLSLDKCGSDQDISCSEKKASVDQSDVGPFALLSHDGESLDISKLLATKNGFTLDIYAGKADISSYSFSSLTFDSNYLYVDSVNKIKCVGTPANAYVVASNPNNQFTVVSKIGDSNTFPLVKMSLSRSYTTITFSSTTASRAKLIEFSGSETSIYVEPYTLTKETLLQFFTVPSEAKLIVGLPDPSATLPIPTSFLPSDDQFKLSGIIGSGIISVGAAIIGLLLAIIIACTVVKKRVPENKEQMYDGDMDLNELENLD